jgi:uncharacterized membrane protein YhhN
VIPLGLAIPVAAVSSAALHIRAEYAGPRWQVYLFKPLTTTLLLILAALQPGAPGPRYQFAVVVGLAFSLLGDIMLMLPRDRFVAGLVSFLIAHLAYIAAFTTGLPPASSPMWLVPWLLAAALLLRLLWPGLGKMRVPVLLYTGTILAMVWRAWARQQALPGNGALLAAAGATLFMVSDSLLALNRFRQPFRLAQAAIMTTYVAAQLLIALSVRAH